MAPNKFEKQLKDTLEGRTIAPSKNAWSQLDTALQTQQDKRKYPFWWLGIAATFLGMFLAIYISKNNTNQTQTIVNEVKNEVIKPNKTNIIKDQPIVKEHIETPIEDKQKIKVKTKNVVANKVQNIKTESDLNSSEKKIQIIKKNEIIIPKNKEITNTVIVDESPSSIEAASLLEAAYSEVKANNNSYQTEKIDANSLLEEVEIKSEKSLKNRLFHAVKSGYETLKTTVVQRNNY